LPWPSASADATPPARSAAGRYVRSDYAIGQEIAIGEVRGRITAIEATSTVLDTGQGRRVRIPNHMLMEMIVTVYEDRPADASA